MEYFYTPQSLVSATHLTIEGEEFGHLTHVMRKKIGDPVRVVDGVGNAYDVIIEALSQRVAHCRIQARHPGLREPVIDVALAVAVLKNQASFDFLVEKCTELGVNAITPLFTERTIPRHAKKDRWQKLALAAMKQCGRCVLPRIQEPQSFDELVTSSRADIKIIPHEKTETPMLSHVVAASVSSVVVCIGPEGGFSESEVSLAAKNEFQPMSLGTRRLRTETAAIVSCGLLLTAR